MQTSPNLQEHIYKTKVLQQVRQKHVCYCWLLCWLLFDITSVYLVPWAHRSTFPMLSFFLRPHHARGLSGWQSLVHAWPISRGEDGEMEVGGNKEFEGEKLRKRRRRVVTGLHILQCNATAWSAATDPLLSHYVLHLTSRLSKLFWVFIHSHCHLYLLVQQLRSAVEYKQVQVQVQYKYKQVQYYICAVSVMEELLPATCMGPI